MIVSCILDSIAEVVSTIFAWCIPSHDPFDAHAYMRRLARSALLSRVSLIKWRRNIPVRARSIIMSLVKYRLTD